MTFILAWYVFFPQAPAALHNASTNGIVPSFFGGAPAITLELPVTGALCWSYKHKAPKARPDWG